MGDSTDLPDNLKNWRLNVTDSNWPCGAERNGSINESKIAYIRDKAPILTCVVTIAEENEMGVNVGGLVAIGIFYLLILGVGLFATWKNRKPKDGGEEKTAEDIMLAKRSISLPVGIMTMTATWVGGGYINGAAEIVYASGSGFAWCQAPFGFSVSLIMGGLFFAKKMRAAGYTTMLDPFQLRFGRIMGGLLFLPAMTGELFWSAAILSALGSTLSVIVDYDRNVCVIISAAIGIFYTLSGGLYAVAYTDVVQLICIAVGLVLAVPFANTHKETLSFVTTYMSNLTLPTGEGVNISDTLPPVTVGWMGAVKTEAFGKFIDIYLLLIFGGIPWQVYFQRVLSAKTANYARGLSFIAGFGCIIMVIPPALIGAIAFSTDWTKIHNLRKDFNFTWNNGSNPNSDDDELIIDGYTKVGIGVTDKYIQPINQIKDSSIVLPLALQYLTPPVVAFIGLGAVSAAVMSSTDSSILGVSSMFARNIYQTIFRPKASEKEMVWVIRGAIVVNGAIALSLGLAVKSVYGLFFLCADFVYVVLFPQLVAVVYIPWVNAYGSLCAYIIGIFLRLGGGERVVIAGEVVMNFAPFIYYPYFKESDEKDNPGEQLFPFRTFAMVMSFVTLIIISCLAHYIFVVRGVSKKYDIFKAFVHRSVSQTYLVSEDEPNLNDTISLQKIQKVEGHTNYGMSNSQSQLPISGNADDGQVVNSRPNAVAPSPAKEVNSHAKY